MYFKKTYDKMFDGINMDILSSGMDDYISCRVLKWRKMSLSASAHSRHEITKGLSQT